MENKDIPHDDKELDEKFTLNPKVDLTKAVKKAKRRTILKTVFISLLVTILVLIGTTEILKILVVKDREQTLAYNENFQKVYGVNQFLGQLQWEENLAGGKMAYTKYKIIEGKEVYTGEDNLVYGPFKSFGKLNRILTNNEYKEDPITGQIKTTYNKLGQRQMLFFYPFIKYRNYKNDFPLLDQIDKNKIMEIGLSFDKEYSIDEVKKMLPSNVTLSWYWIDDVNNSEKQNLGFAVCTESNACGIKAIDGNGNPVNDPVKDFSKSLLQGIYQKTNIYFMLPYMTLTGKQAPYQYKKGDILQEIKPENIQVMGVVVTGDTEKLKSLRNLPFIKAATIGVITDKY